MKDLESYSIEELEQLTGVNRRRISYYISEGLLPKVGRRGRGTRYGREFVDRCGVVLPKGYDDDPQRRYPVIYSIPGFSGTHRDALRYADGPPEPGGKARGACPTYLGRWARQGAGVRSDPALPARSRDRGGLARTIHESGPCLGR